MRRTVIIAVAGTLLVLVTARMLIDAQWILFRGSTTLDARHEARLRDEATAALASRDVPVGALLFYGDSVIGVGHNTVRRDANAGGHAEINAISDAIGRFGVEGFNALNRDSVWMVTTFEPCVMCRGAILEYGIRNVRFVKGKSSLQWLREDARLMRYQLLRRQTGIEEMQDSLFKMYK